MHLAGRMHKKWSKTSCSSFLFPSCDHFMLIGYGANYYTHTPVAKNLQLGVACGLWMTTRHRGTLFLLCLERFMWSAAESEPGVARSVEAKQTIQRELFQCRSRLCRCCVLEPHNALAWRRKWHIPYPDSPSVGENSPRLPRHDFENLFVILEVIKTALPLDGTTRASLF